MNSLKLVLLGCLFLEALSLGSSKAQVYHRYRYQRRYPPQMQGQMAQTNAVAQAATNAPPQSPPLAQTAPATNSLGTATNRPAFTYVRVVQRPVDPEKAKAAKAETVRRTVEFQKKRAEEGSESAQYELGVRYLKGDGVDKDEAAARKWLGLSAQNGYTPAAKKLEELDKPPKPAPEETAKPVSEK